MNLNLREERGKWTGRRRLNTVIIYVQYNSADPPATLSVSRLGLVVRRSAGKRKGAGSTPRFGSPFSSKMVIYGHCLVTLP